MMSFIPILKAFCWFLTFTVSNLLPHIDVKGNAAPVFASTSSSEKKLPADPLLHHFPILHPEYCDELKSELQFKPQQFATFFDLKDDQLLQFIKQTQDELEKARFIEQLNLHFLKFGHPSEQQFVNGKNFIMAKNHRNGLANWLFEFIDADDFEMTNKYNDPLNFTHKKNKKSRKILAKLNQMSNCISGRNKAPLFVLTGAFLLDLDTKLITTKKNLINVDQIFFKVFFVERKAQKFCVEIIVTNSKLSMSEFDLMKMDDCGRRKLAQSFDDAIGAKYSQTFKGPKEFIEWQLGMELSDFMLIAGVQDKNNNLDECGDKINKMMNKNMTNDINITKIMKNLMRENRKEIAFNQPSLEWMFRRIREESIDEKQQKLTNMRIYQSFMVHFNRRLRIPNFSIEILEKKSVLERMALKNLRGAYRWEQDPDYEENFQPTYHDYDSGRYRELNHGHLAPVHNHFDNQEETFYMTNSAPQWEFMNSGHWRLIEEYTRCIGDESTMSYIYTGTLFKRPQQEDGNDPLEYMLLGERKVAVPTHFFKVILSVIPSKEENATNKNCWLEAYIVPNERDSNEIYEEKPQVIIQNWDESQEKLPKEVHYCRNKGYQGKPILHMLEHYWQSLDEIEQDWESRLLPHLSELAEQWPMIRKAKGGVEFDCTNIGNKTREQESTLADKLMEELMNKEQQEMENMAHLRGMENISIKYSIRPRAGIKIRENEEGPSSSADASKNDHKHKPVMEKKLKRSSSLKAMKKVSKGKKGKDLKVKNKKASRVDKEKDLKVKSKKASRVEKGKGILVESSSSPALDNLEEMRTSLEADNDNECDKEDKEREWIEFAFTELVTPSLGEYQPDGNYRINEAISKMNLNTKYISENDITLSNELQAYIVQCLKDIENSNTNREQQVFSILKLVKIFRQQWAYYALFTSEQRYQFQTDKMLLHSFVALNACITSWMQQYIPRPADDDLRQKEIYIGDALQFMRKKLPNNENALEEAEIILINFNKQLFKFDAQLTEAFKSAMSIIQDLYKATKLKYGNDLPRKVTNGIGKENKEESKNQKEVKKTPVVFKISLEDVKKFYILISNLNYMLSNFYYYGMREIRNNSIVLHNYMVKYVLNPWGHLYKKYVNPDCIFYNEALRNILMEWIGENHREHVSEADISLAFSYYEIYNGLFDQGR